MQWLISIILLFGLTGCETDFIIAPSTVKPLSEARPVIEANNQFALEFYANLKDKEEGENIFFSPYSISTAIAMMYEGALNKTAEEIQSVFHFPNDQSLRRASFEVVQSYLNRQGMPYELSAANALWVEKEFDLQSAFKTALTKFYKGEAFAADFKMASERERQRINAWVEDKTKEKIKDLLPQGSVNSLTRLVLTNAIYFKGKWENQFKKDQTRDEDFWLNENQTTEVPMMWKSGDFNYAQTEELQILEIPYEAGELSMLILLPKGKRAEDLRSLEESLTIDNLNFWRESLRGHEMDEVFIPKFTFERSYQLKKNLEAMGMPLAFNRGGADFSGINKEETLYVDDIYHKAFVEVNEEGTEAAAATGIEFETVSLRPQAFFKADHPFIFLIQERTTGYILFMGKVANPVK